MPLEIPGHEHFISAFARTGEDLLIRLADDYHAGHDAAAFELRAQGVANAQAVAEFLSRTKASAEYLYAFERDGTVLLSGESGDEIPIRARAIECRRDALNLEELSDALAQSRAQYERENESCRRLSLRLQGAREVVQEQLRRLEVKAGAHEQTSVAGVLYAQQVQFLERLLRDTEA